MPPSPPPPHSNNYKSPIKNDIAGLAHFTYMEGRGFSLSQLLYFLK